MVVRSCWLEIANGYTSCSGGGGAAAYAGSPRTSSSSSTALPPLPDWLLQCSQRLTTLSKTGAVSKSPLESSTDCMCAMFLVQLLVEQQKGEPALRLLGWLEPIFPTSPVVLSQVLWLSSVPWRVILILLPLCVLLLCDYVTCPVLAACCMAAWMLFLIPMHGGGGDGV
jgi:hypothetical protein